MGINSAVHLRERVVRECYKGQGMASLLTELHHHMCTRGNLKTVLPTVDSRTKLMFHPAFHIFLTFFSSLHIILLSYSSHMLSLARNTCGFLIIIISLPLKFHRKYTHTTVDIMMLQVRVKLGRSESLCREHTICTDCRQKVNNFVKA